MTSYQTKYSQLSNVSRKEKKQKVNQFPFIAPNSNLSTIDLCAQRVNRGDIGITVKFCPLCDFPMIVRLLILPCEHIICYNCSLPETDTCYVCEGTITNTKRISDKTRLFECDYPDCFKFSETSEKLLIHKQLAHNQPYYFNLLGDKTSTLTPIPTISSSPLGGSIIPLGGGNPILNTNNMNTNIYISNSMNHNDMNNN